MKSLRNLGEWPPSLPLLADDILEFHAARLLLLFKLCGKDGRIKGLTKMAKLDFFVRYPQFFTVACRVLDKETASSLQGVESSMIRYHYGPWDRRYYHILAYLESRGLIKTGKEKDTFDLVLTPTGEKVALDLEEQPAFDQLVKQMYQVREVLGGKSGSRLKKLIYEIFDQEVVKLSLGEIIKQ